MKMIPGLTIMLSRARWNWVPKDGHSCWDYGSGPSKTGTTSPLTIVHCGTPRRKVWNSSKSLTV